MSGAGTRIVAIGASAGGLEAIGRLLAAVRPGLGCAYVVLQHISPARPSAMAALLAGETSLNVVTLADHAEAVADTVYVVPAGYDADIADGRLRLTPVPAETSPKPSIDRFFVALAAEQRERATGIVLSGTGSDGSAGLRAIAEAGGRAAIQQPGSAAYDGMPASALESVAIAFVGTPEEIACQLPVLLDMDAPGDDADDADDQLTELLGLLSARSDIDVSGYKTGTVRRRIERRQGVVGVASLAEYLALVRDDPGELDALAHDMLVSVTAFFRDPAAFEAVTGAIAGMLDEKEPAEGLRLWVAGCATGEEAYTLAMIVADLTTGPAAREIQIFATDIDERALAVARRGVYPASALGDLPDEVVAKYFHLVEGGHRVDKRLRDMIVFARHNLVCDPPFLRLDVITCRNVLIYFDAALQSKVLAAFHFALGADGILLLGKSETVASAESLFVPVDRVARVYRRAGGVSRLPVPRGGHPSRRVGRRVDVPVDDVLAATAKTLDATVILCDRDGTVQYTVGRVASFLAFPTGAARLAIVDAIAVELRGELLTMLHRFRATAKPQQSRHHSVGDQVVRVLLEPLSDHRDSPIAIVIVPAVPAAREHGRAPDAGHGLTENELTHELASTREHLHALREEMAAGNQEMQALSEELQVANEELQAANEELQASNETLQAANEELVSLNAEYNSKATELTRISDEYAHLYDTLPFAVLVLDGDGKLLRFNRAAARSLSLADRSVGHPISELQLPDAFAGLQLLLDKSVKTGAGEDFTVTWDRRIFRVQVTPATDDRRRVVTFAASIVDMTDITEAQQRLLDSEARLQALLEVTTAVYAIKNVNGTYQYVNQKFLDMFGLTEPPVERTDFDIMPSHLAGELWSADLEALRTGAPQDREYAVNVSGAMRFLASTHRVLLGRNGTPTGYLFEARDVTVQKGAEDILRVSATVFEQAGEAIVITDPDGRIQTCNVAFEVITGFTTAEVTGMRLELFFGVSGDGGESAMWSELRRHGRWRGEIIHRRKNQESYPAWVTISRSNETPGRVEHFVAVFSDISQIKNVQRRTEFLSTHDELTRLPNRALFTELLEEGIERSSSEPGVFAMFFIDIDHFKYVNDMLGHSVGDELLKLAAKRIRSVVRDEDTVARFGGDEFVALVRRPNRQDIETLAADVVNTLSRTYAFDGLDVFSSASVGLAFHPDDGADGEALLNAADAAMYHAKSQGRDRVGLFDPSIGERLRRDARIERGLRRSLREDVFRLMYQPIHRIAGDREIVGLEALLRWEDSELGPVSPAEFIPIAERCGLIVALDRVGRDLLLAQLTRWRGDGYAVPPVSLNVSPWSLREAEFATELLAAMSAAGIEGSGVRLEITESALLQDEGAVSGNLMALGAAGVVLSIDDFGTGYSSLSYLRRLPLAELKIDRSLTAGISRVAEDGAVALAILGLAKNLGLSTVAEGIENEQQRSWLEDHGCEYGQGFGLSHPGEPAVIADLLMRGADPR